MIATSAPYSQYFDKNGDPLDSGFVFFGVPDANPETSPIPAYWDEAGTQPVAQPARTLAGYIVRNGTPARVYVEGAYSQTVRNKKGELVYYAANSEDYSNLPVNVATIEATAGQTNVNLPFSYTRGNNSLAVYLNGTLLLKDRDYIETSETSIQMLYPLRVGPGGADEVTAIGGRLINPSSAVGTVSAAALAAGSGAGLVGYDPSLTFPADTVGERLQRTTFTVDAITAVDVPALGIVNGDMVVARGRSSAGDAGGGTFRYVAASTQTVDGGMVFAPTAGSGRLFRQGWTVVGFNDRINLRWFGAVGNGFTDDSAALALWLAAIQNIPTVAGAKRKSKGYAPAGVYYYTSNLSLVTDASNGIDIEGDGVQATLFSCGALDGDAMTCATQRFELQNFGIIGTSARRAAPSTGRGLYIDAALSTTSGPGTVRNVNITSHPGDGCVGVQIEHHIFERVWTSGNGGRGFFMSGGPGQSSWNTFIACRALGNAGDQWEFDGTTLCYTLINCEGLQIPTTKYGFRIAGRRHNLINPDAEGSGIVSGATDCRAMRITGTAHKVTGGYIGDINAAIDLISAVDCEIDSPEFNNNLSGVTAAYCVNEDAGSSRNRLRLPSSVSLFTAVLTPSTGQSGTIVEQGLFGAQMRPGTFTPTIGFAGGTTGITYTTQTGKYRRQGDMVYIEFDITLSSKGSSTGSAFIAGLPFAAAAGLRGMMSITLVTVTGATNTDASSINPSTSTILLRAQAATSIADITDATFNNTTRLYGSGWYIAA